MICPDLEYRKMQWLHQDSSCNSTVGYLQTIHFPSWASVSSSVNEDIGRDILYLFSQIQDSVATIADVLWGCGCCQGRRPGLGHSEGGLL